MARSEMSKKTDDREIYSIQDAQDILEKVLNDQLGLGDKVIEVLNEILRSEFEYINWIRFCRTCCPGCVSGPEECVISRGVYPHQDIWKKIVAGEATRCPARTNGTMVFSPEEGMQKIDLQGDDYTVVKPFNVEDD